MNLHALTSGSTGAVDTLTTSMPRRNRVEVILEQPRNFAEESVPVLEQLQVAVAALLAALPQVVTRGADIGRMLQIDRAMAWTVYRLATATDPLAAGPFVPKAKTMTRFLEAAREVGGVSSDVTRRVEEAFANFESLVRRHAADRSTFDSMIRDLHGEEAGKDDLKHKRASYRAARHFCGIHADVCLHTWLFMPLVNRMMDTVSIQGYVRIQQGRSNTTLLSSHGVRIGDTEARDYREIRPLEAGPDEDQPMGGFTLLKKFCSDPLPDLRTIKEESQVIRADVHSRGMGSKEATTYFFAGKSRAEQGVDERKIQIYTSAKVPSQAYVIDAWLHDDLLLDGSPTVGLYLNRGYRLPNLDVTEADYLHLHEDVREMPRGQQASFIPEYPQYGEMMNYVAKLSGWSMHNFRLIRCRIEFPPVGSTIVMMYPFAG